MHVKSESKRKHIVFTTFRSHTVCSAIHKLTQLDILTLLFLQHLGVIRFVVPFIRAGLTQLDILTWKAQ